MTCPCDGLKKSERTRLAILESARKAFTEKGYDQVGVREIAAGADVTAALVNRYFGSKRNLLREVLYDDNDYTELHDGPPAELGKRFAAFLVHGGVKRKNGEQMNVRTDLLLIFARSVGCDEAVPVLREHLADKITGPLMKALPGENLQAKASLLVSHFFGFLIVHTIIGAGCAVKADPDVLERQLAASFQSIIDS